MCKNMSNMITWILHYHLSTPVRLVQMIVTDMHKVWESRYCYDSLASKYHYRLQATLFYFHLFRRDLNSVVTRKFLQFDAGVF